MQVASACFIQPPLCYVGMTEEEAREKLSGDIDIFVSKFKPLKNTLSGRDEKTLMKLIVHVPSDTVTSYILPAAAHKLQQIPSGLRPGNLCPPELQEHNI